MSRVIPQKDSIENIFIREGIMNIGEMGIGWFLKGVEVLFWIVAYLLANSFSIDIAWEVVGLIGWEAFMFSAGVLVISSITFVGYVLRVVEGE